LPDLSEKMGRGPGELEHRTGRRLEQYDTQLVADAVCCAPAEKLPEKIFRPDTTHSVTRSILCARESRLDAIYEHLQRDASALERLGMRTAYCG
jgi:hypothetical protein